MEKAERDYANTKIKLEAEKPKDVARAVVDIGSDKALELIDKLFKEFETQEKAR